MIPHNTSEKMDSSFSQRPVPDTTASLPLILASRSPRRRELLAHAGYDFQIMPPDEEAEDSRLPNETPTAFVRRFAAQKAQNVARQIEKGRIIACDTIVVCNDTILEKPVDRNDARRMLQLLRGNKHLVLSGLCILAKVRESAPPVLTSQVATTELFMQPISDEEIEEYLRTDAWQGKAGAFGYQDRNTWIAITHGSESNVVGLPMELLETMIRESMS